MMFLPVGRTSAPHTYSGKSPAMKSRRRIVDLLHWLREAIAVGLVIKPALRNWPIVEMPAGARHGRLPTVNLPPRSLVVKRERIAPMPRPRDVRCVPRIRLADTPGSCLRRAHDLVRKVCNFSGSCAHLPGTPPVPRRMLFAHEHLILLDFASFAPQFPARREFNRELLKIVSICPLSVLRRGLIS
jgi:hypothetical protein